MKSSRRVRVESPLASSCSTESRDDDNNNTGRQHKRSRQGEQEVDQNDAYPLDIPADYGNLANSNKVFPQREDQEPDDAASSHSSAQRSVSSDASSALCRSTANKAHDDPQNLPRDGFKSIDDEKRDLLHKLKRLRDQKVQISRDYGMHSPIHDLRHEYDVIRKTMQTEGSIRFQRKALIAITSGMEFLNNKYDPFNVELNGWSETIMESITDYDQIFERLHEKYKGSASMPPEFELMMAVVGSAFTFHLSNTFFKKSMGDAIKNPTAMRNIMSEIKKASSSSPQQPQHQTPPPQQYPQQARPPPPPPSYYPPPTHAGYGYTPPSMPPPTQSMQLPMPPRQFETRPQPSSMSEANRAQPPPPPRPPPSQFADNRRRHGDFDGTTGGGAGSGGNGADSTDSELSVSSISDEEDVSVFASSVSNDDDDDDDSLSGPATTRRTTVAGRRRAASATPSRAAGGGGAGKRSLTLPMNLGGAAAGRLGGARGGGGGGGRGGGRKAGRAGGRGAAAGPAVPLKEIVL